jgi:2',3'-cyclic-nucleotide 2'-phosphodiesterase (5'-nucleotidase family)
MKKKVITGVLGLSMLLMSGCTSTKSTQINILATTDLHGSITPQLEPYVKEERKKDKNAVLVDAGDFFDSGQLQGLPMGKYFDERDKDKKKYVETPIAKEMKEVGYDAVVLGNHEFISNDKFSLDNMVSDFGKQNIDVLSANTYKQNGSSYIKPYIIKEVHTSKGNVKLGILGLTIKEVGQKYTGMDKGVLIKAKSLELKDQRGYNGTLYMNDLVEDAKKWVKVMKEKDKPDVILAVVHSGEKPKKPKNPGNRIQELAKEVEGIDAIVAGHNHEEIKQHDYKNKSGETVIVTEPGANGECISKINIQLEKDNNKWDVVNKSSQITKFPRNPEYDNYPDLSSKILKLDEKTKEIRLSEVTSFDWDKAYVFEPYTPIEKIYKTVGYKWRNITEADSEDILQMVFMKDKKVICYAYTHRNQVVSTSMKFDKSEYKDNSATIYPKDNDKFKIIGKDEENFNASLEHIK